MSKQIFITLSTYPLFLLQLPQLHVFDALLLIGLLDKRDLFKAFCPLKIVNLWHKKEGIKAPFMYRYQIFLMNLFLYLLFLVFQTLLQLLLLLL